MVEGTGIDVYDAIQCMVEWKSVSGHTFNQTLLVNWIDPETTSAMSDQKINFIGTNGRYESNQKERGIRIMLDGQPMEEPNPDFCRDYRSDDGKSNWEGYGIDSIMCFLNDVYSIINRKNIPQFFEGKRPTFSESLFSTAVIIEAATKSLEELSVWEII